MDQSRPEGRAARILIRLGILADAETSARLAAVDAELDAIELYRRLHLAHPTRRGMDATFDAAMEERQRTGRRLLIGD